jgi:hypothetical protein
VRREKSALFQWEEDIPPGNCCSSRKQPERGLLVTAEREAFGAKGSAKAESASTQARMKTERRASLETGKCDCRASSDTAKAAVCLGREKQKHQAGAPGYWRWHVDQGRER